MPELFQSAVMWGPGILILAGIFVLLRKPPEFVGEFITAQKSQAVAMDKLASAVDQVSDRTSKLDEILVGQQLILQRQESLERTINLHLGGSHGSG
jgi:hypothetical protein